MGTGCLFVEVDAIMAAGQESLLQMLQYRVQLGTAGEAAEASGYGGNA